ncbi:MAG: hypothetical protein ACM3ZE_18245, partial [Myxococcales bacterium]
MSLHSKIRHLSRVASHLGALFSITSIAIAQPSDTERARADVLFDEAMQLMQSGQYKLACSKFEESQQLAPAMGNQFNLADCYAKTGRAVVAWKNYTQVADAARLKGDQARESVALARAREVERQIAFLVLNVRERVAGMTVRCDSVAIDDQQLGTPLPIAPGKHVISVSAPGAVDWSKTVELVGEGEKLEVELPTLKANPSPTRASAPLVQALDASIGAPAQAVPAWPHSHQRIWALISAGVGVTGLGVGTAMVIVAESKHNKADPFCDEREQCTRQIGVDALHDAKTLGDWANLPFGIGV